MAGQGRLDGQLGVFESLYENDAMPTELAAYLPAARRDECLAMLHRHVYWDYSEATPNDASNRAHILDCAAEMAEAIKKADAGDPKARDERLEMLRNIGIFVSLSAGPTSELIRGRDLAMYLNFRWLAERLPPHSKIIVWTQNAHVAKSAADAPDFAGIRSLGAFVHERYGERAFALGVTAQSGSYRYSRHDNKPLPPFAKDALESRSGAGPESIYLGPARLRALGKAPAAFYQHAVRQGDWSAAFDGAIVLDEERPPHSTRPGYE